MFATGSRSATGGNGGPVLTSALVSIASNIQRLYPAGARQFQLLTAIVANPAAYELTNVHAACVTPNIPPFYVQAG